jgi:Flp pilus assembly protein TadB
VTRDANRRDEKEGKREKDTSLVIPRQHARPPYTNLINQNYQESAREFKRGREVEREREREREREVEREREEREREVERERRYELDLLPKSGLFAHTVHFCFCFSSCICPFFFAIDLFRMLMCA